MWLKLVLAGMGLALVADRLIHWGDAWTTGFSPTTEGVLYIAFGVTLVLVGVVLPKEFVRDLY